MKLYELVNKYHVDTELSCAEAMFKACNEYYNLNLNEETRKKVMEAARTLNEETRKMFSIMGLGMQTELSCCGAYTVAIAMIGLFTAQEGRTDCDNIMGYTMVNDFTDFYISNFGSLQCCSLQNQNFEGYDNPCHKIVEAAAKELEDMLSSDSSCLV